MSNISVRKALLLSHSQIQVACSLCFISHQIILHWPIVVSKYNGIATNSNAQMLSLFRKCWPLFFVGDKCYQIQFACLCFVCHRLIFHKELTGGVTHKDHDTFKIKENFSKKPKQREDKLMSARSWSESSKVYLGSQPGRQPASQNRFPSIVKLDSQ